MCNPPPRTKAKRLPAPGGAAGSHRLSRRLMEAHAEADAYTAAALDGRRATKTEGFYHRRAVLAAARPAAVAAATQPTGHWQVPGRRGSRDPQCVGM